MLLLRENCTFLKARGFEVGAWLWAFLYTLPADYTRMQAPDGRVSSMTVCPTDPAYRREMGLFLREIAETGVDMIMFDDDYRYGFQDMGFGCTCPLHRRRIEALLGVGDAAEAEKLLKRKIVLTDVKEGEVSLTNMWFYLCALKEAKAKGVEVTDEMVKHMAETVTPPAHLDFRMH